MKLINPPLRRSKKEGKHDETQEPYVSEKPTRNPAKTAKITFPMNHLTGVENANPLGQVGRFSSTKRGGMIGTRGPPEKGVRAGKKKIRTARKV